MPGLTADEFVERISRLREHLADKQIDLAVLNHNGEFAVAGTVPEPSSFLILARGLGTLLGMRRRRAYDDRWVEPQSPRG